MHPGTNTDEVDSSLSLVMPFVGAAPVSTTAASPVLPRVARGDEDAVRECLQRYGRLVYSIAWRFTNDAAEADDACQDIFVALWRSAATFDPARGAEATFVAMIARRRLVDRQRTRGTRPLPELEADPAPVASTVETYVDARAAVAALADCSEDQRRVVQLAAFQGMTHDEIATELAMPLGTVKSHYARAIQRVKRALTRGEDES